MSSIRKITIKNMGYGGFTFNLPQAPRNPLEITWLVENFDQALSKVDFNLRGKDLIEALTTATNWALETTFKKRQPPEYFENLIDDLVLIALARRSGYRVENARDAEEVIIFDNEGYPIGVKEAKGSQAGRLDEQREVTGRAISAGVRQNILSIERVNNPTLLGVSPELVAALAGLDYSVIHSGVVRYGNELFFGKRYLVLDGERSQVRMDNGEFESFQTREEKNTKILSVRFKHSSALEMPLSVPCVLVRTKHGLDDHCIVRTFKEYVFVPGSNENLDRAIECLGKECWYKAIKKRPLKPDIYFIAKYKACMRNGNGNLLLFFHNGRCLEVRGKREFTVILQEVEVKT